MNYTPEQSAFCIAARAAPVVTTLRQLLDLLAPQTAAGEGILTRLAALSAVLEMVGLQATTSLEDGDLDSPRLIAAARPTATTEAQLLAEINDDENENLELKSSFSCCVRTLRNTPGLEPRHYVKPIVEDSALSAIAGLMNAAGGVLYLGVEDNRNVIGLEATDYFALGLADSDKWLLRVRSKINSFFHEGVMVNEHVSFSFAQVHGVTIARAVVQPRIKVALLRAPDGGDYYRLLHRQGNQTAEIKTPGMQEFYERRFLSRR